MDLHYPNDNLSTPLTTTIERSDPVILSMLIDKLPANLDSTLTQPCGKTALMHAAFRARDPEVLQVLMKKGADKFKTDIHGWNCLFYAIVGRRLSNIVELLDNELSLESKDANGRTPLMISVYLSDYEVFDFLIDKGADVNAVDKYGLSVLHIAILKRKRDCVIKLRKVCSNKDLRTPFAKVSFTKLIDDLMSDKLPREDQFE